MNINSAIELSFDLTKRKNPITISAKQCDDRTRSVTVKLTQGGKTFKKPDGAEIKLCGTKPDSTVFELIPTYSSDNSYTFFLTDYVLAAKGRIRCEVKCSWNDQNHLCVCSTEIFYIINVASAITPGNASIGAELKSVERATAAAHAAAETAAQTVEALLESRNNGEFNGPEGERGYTPQKGVDYFTENDKTEFIEEVKSAISEDGIPDYWKSHLYEKISSIRELQNKGGKDCFSFVVITDMHYPSNLGKNAPLLAKKILDECDMKYALCLGDVQTRGCHATKESLLAENEAIKKMLSPIRDRLLQTQGNHDGNYGTLNGTNYVYRITPQELHSTIYRKVGVVGDVHFDESGSGYYVDDTANKVRYILLNTHNTAYELNADGTQKYPNMHVCRFGQSQYNLVIEALNTIPTDSWTVVVAGHVALGTNGGYSAWGDGTTAGADCYLMENLLAAYKNKTPFSGSFAGTAEGVAYKNLAEPLPDNTTDTSKWVNGQRISSSGISAESGTTLSNPIYCKVGDVIRVKGVTFRSNKDRYGSWCVDSDPNTGHLYGNGIGYVSVGSTDYVSVTQNGDVYEFTVLKANGRTLDYMRFAFETPTNPADVIITVNEEIVEAEHGYDYVFVDCDFTNAKGKLVGFFGGHTHTDSVSQVNGINRITTRCDAKEENTEELNAERIVGTITEQSFDVFTVDKASKSVYVTKIGAGDDRIFYY